jgi:hypothetical protein
MSRSPRANVFTKAVKAEAEHRCDVRSGVKAGPDAGGRPREERDVVSKREVVPQEELAPESCLHCEINDLVQERVEGLEEPLDIVALAYPLFD